ncbi:MAG: fatty acid desaturase, partial [Planctomycetales bacterium]
ITVPAASMTTIQPKLSDLGLNLLHLSRWQKARSLAYPFVAWIAYWSFATSGHWLPGLLSLVALSFTTYGSTSHDLVHRNLGLSSRKNDILLSLLELIALRSGHAYQAAHLNHHARFPHSDDIEADAARMSLARAILEGIVFQFRIYAWALHSPNGKQGWIVAEGMAVLMITAAAIALLPRTVVPIAYVGLMLAGSWIIPLITSYLVHDATSSDPLHQTRRFRGVIARIVSLDHLFHLEHHLYPAVPHQNWSRLARCLDRWFDANGIKPVRIWF